MTEMLELEFTEAPISPPAGNAERFTSRLRLVGAGLSNVWRYGNLELPATSGRLLLRGPNGTGKTTALEALWPFLLDLDHGQGKLSAGKARTTTLKQLMAEGAKEKGRRYGYVWLTVAPPIGLGEPEDVTWGVRLQYSPSSSPAVTVVPFTVPGRPVRDFALETESGSTLEHDSFTRLIESHGGQVFADVEAYVEDLSARVFSATPRELRDLAGRLRQVRNPALLGELSADKAAEALRESLPNVDSGVIAETAEALAASETTREAFERDRRAAQVLADFARVWAGHVTEVAKGKLTAAEAAVGDVSRLRKAQAMAEHDVESAASAAEESGNALAELDRKHTDAANQVRAIELSHAYKAAGTIRDLSARLTAERAAAGSSAATLTATAHAAAQEAQAALSALDNVLDQLTEVVGRAQDAGQPGIEIETLLAHHDRPRQVRIAADVVAVPGTGVNVVHDADAWTALGSAWEQAARALTTQADTAELLVTDHARVDEAERRRRAAVAELEKAEKVYGVEQQLLTVAAREAAAAAQSLVDDVTAWTQTHRELCAVDPLDLELGQHWLSEDVAALAGAEPAEVLADVSEWADLAKSAAERIAAHCEAAAGQHDQRARDLDAQAAQLRERAGQLRAGKLLAFPRPQWAGEGDDVSALGSVLEWADGVDANARDHLEAALAGSGLLTAHLGADATSVEVATPVWRVSSRGAVVASNLTAVLTVDPDHPAAAAAWSVLERIELTDTATAAAGGGLVIGRDGTFAAGPLVADPVAAASSDGQTLPAAEYVGARTRRERALAEAAALEQQAEEAAREAGSERASAQQGRDAAGAARTDGRSFPSRAGLRDLEASRSNAAQRTILAEETRAAATTKAEATIAEHQQLKDEWSRSATAAGFPADVTRLSGIVDDRRGRAREVKAARGQLRKLAAGALRRALELVPDEEALALKLARLESEAQQAHRTAGKTQELLDEVSRDSGADDAVERHQTAEAEMSRLEGQLTPAKTQADTDRDAKTRAETAVGPARKAVIAAIPAQTAALAALRTLLTWPPAAAALDVPGFLATTGGDVTRELGEGAELLRDATALLERKPTSARKTLTDRYDTAKAELAQTWTLVFGEAPAGIDVDMFDLTHDENTYDPAGAAAKADELAQRAESALDAAEAEALQRFVVGKLPTSIGHAWQQLQDWTREVNAKMRSAQASSGVGVRVRITPRDDLDPAAQTVYDLACKLSDAARTEEQRRDVGEAIERRLAAANGDTMAERLTDAVDITSWVDVDYMVTRADDPEKERKWGRKTGLSGGERRLVVLAPMLAAIAAGYDRFGAEALRLLPLDEVPAEVDEQGREGLARYIAQLDLDLIATSYLWDGAPGAWDGIDAHDLESGSDGTVVAFPMLVRGLLRLPGDAEYVTSPSQES